MRYGSTIAPVEIRPATRADALAIAALHADSWRRNYRGAYSDRYLGDGLDAERAREWTRRLDGDDPGAFTLVARDGGELAGFVHVRLDADAEGGTLIDNLHVADRLRGSGVGTRLLAAAAGLLLERRPSAEIHLLVQEQNVAAQGFYRARGGRVAGRMPCPPPEGDPRNLAGAPFLLRVVWPGPRALAAGTTAGRPGGHPLRAR